MTLKLCCEESPTCNKSKEFLKKHDSLIRKQTLEEVLKIVDAKYPDGMYSGEILNKLSEWLERKIKEASK
jgi:hypothetical protein